MKKIIVAVVAASALGIGLVQVPDSDILSKRRSCGYQCQPDGNNATPSAPPEQPEIQNAGRTNPHSSGRTGGRANKRHGGGGRNHPNADEGILIYPEIQPAGRTNVHSGGRQSNTVQPRHGGQQQPRIKRGVRKLGFTLQVETMESIQPT